MDHALINECIFLEVGPERISVVSLRPATEEDVRGFPALLGLRLLLDGDPDDEQLFATLKVYELRAEECRAPARMSARTSVATRRTVKVTPTASLKPV